MTIRFTGLDGVDLASDLSGRWDDPLVVLLHGGGQTRFSWGSTADRLAAEGFLTLNLDARGHGESGWSGDGIYSLDRYAADLRAVLSRLDRPAALVGASLGGLTSLVAAGEAPEVDCTALVLVDVTPRMNRVGRETISSFMAANSDGFPSVEAAADAVAAYLPHRPRPADVSGLRKNLREADDGRLYWHWDPRMIARAEEGGLRDVGPERFEAALRALDSPVMLVRGRFSEIVGDEEAAAFRKVRPDAEYVDIPGAAHMVAGDRNDVFTSSVADFLIRVHDPVPTRSLKH